VVRRGTHTVPLATNQLHPKRLFITDGLTDQDLFDYAYLILNEVSKNEIVVDQIADNSPDQALSRDFTVALDEAVVENSEAHHSLLAHSSRLRFSRHPLADQYQNSKELQAGFQRLVFDLLLVRLA
jgi:type I restriction enzyme R subunit